jgi:hypothetical protein
VFGWPDPNMGFDQSEHVLYTCYFIKYIIICTFPRANEDITYEGRVTRQPVYIQEETVDSLSTSITVINTKLLGTLIYNVLQCQTIYACIYSFIEIHNNYIFIP